jgi:predicted DNA-binding protein
MTTLKKRIQVTLNSETEKIMSAISKRDKTPIGTKAAELIEIALEIEEDAYWSKMAEERLAQTKTFYTHEQMLKKISKNKK